MTIEQMEQEIKDYCIKLILDSTIDDWSIGEYSSRELIQNNIAIRLGMNCFQIYIYTDNTRKTQNKEFYIRNGWCWNKKERKIRNLLTEKYKEIFYYFKNKEEYEKISKTYNLLPIKEIRKRKLKEIDENINTEI